MRTAILALFLAGCSSLGTTTKKPYQDYIVWLIWNQLYSQTNQPPEIEWHHGVQLWDGGPAGFTYAGWKVCVTDSIWDGNPSGSQVFEFSATPLAHELMHERTFERTGDVDAFHWRGDWALVDQVNTKIRRIEDSWIADGVIP